MWQLEPQWFLIGPFRANAKGSNSTNEVILITRQKKTEIHMSTNSASKNGYIPSACNLHDQNKNHGTLDTHSPSSHVDIKWIHWLYLECLWCRCLCWHPFLKIGKRHFNYTRHSEYINEFFSTTSTSTIFPHNINVRSSWKQVPT